MVLTPLILVRQNAVNRGKRGVIPFLVAGCQLSVVDVGRGTLATAAQDQNITYAWIVDSAYGGPFRKRLNLSLSRRARHRQRRTSTT
jgi:hypothetical protein